MALRRAGKGYVLGVASTTQFHSWDKPEPVSGTAEAIAAALPASRWVRLSAGAGGPRLYEGYLELADLDARSFFDCRSASTMWTLLIRRGLSDGKMAFFSTWCPMGTPMAVLVEVEGRRWAIEDAFETAKTELGLDHNETRSWHGWHRHVSLVMLAFAMLMVIRHKADPHLTPKKTTDRTAQTMVRWSLQEIRRVAGRLAQRQIEPAFVIAWSVWRRCHQAEAKKAHLKRRNAHAMLMSSSLSDLTSRYGT